MRNETPYFVHIFPACHVFFSSFFYNSEWRTHIDKKISNSAFTQTQNVEPGAHSKITTVCVISLKTFWRTNICMVRCLLAASSYQNISGSTALPPLDFWKDGEWCVFFWHFSCYKCLSGCSLCGNAAVWSKHFSEIMSQEYRVKFGPPAEDQQSKLFPFCV